MNVENDEKIFTKSFFLIFGALLFTALVMYALMSTVTEYATAMGSSATIAENGINFHEHSFFILYFVFFCKRCEFTFDCEIYSWNRIWSFI